MEHNEDSAPSTSGVESDVTLFYSGVRDFLKPLAERTDEQVRATTASQAALAESLQALTHELQGVVENADELPPLAEYAAKLARSKKRVADIQTVLSAVVSRVETVEKLAQQYAAVEERRRLSRSGSRA